MMAWCRWYTVALLVALLSVVVAVYYQSVYGTQSHCDLSQVDLTDKVVVVTGANTGIGYHIAVEAASRGARVIMGCRSPEKGRKARDQVVAESGSSTVALIGLDLSSIKKVHKFVDKVIEDYGKVDILINNAAIGIGEGVEGRQVTAEGLELLLATNHLGPLHLTTRLLPVLADTGKVITISSDSNLHVESVNPGDLNSEQNYTPHTLYATTKLYNIMMTRSLVTRLGGMQRAYSVDPGFTWTNIHTSQLPLSIAAQIWLFGPLLGAWSSGVASRTPVWLAGGRGAGPNGQHWYNCRHSTQVHPLARDTQLMEAVWQHSIELINSALQS